MVKNKQIDRKKLYEHMIVSEKEAYAAQDNLLGEIKKWFSNVMDEETANHTKIILAHGGYIQIRTVQKLSDDILKSFMDEFYFNQTWHRDEFMIDYSNIETVTVHIYEYAFLPKNINEITGNNQVDLIKEE